MSPHTLREILAGRPVIEVSPATPVRDAAQLMETHRVGAVVVLEKGQLVGILSERDIVFRGVGHDLPVAETPVAALMTPDPVTLDIDDAISDALALKIGDAFRHLPVMENGAVVGVLSYRDIPAEYAMMFERFREMSGARADEEAGGA